MESTSQLREQIRQMIITDLMLQVKPEEITDEMPLFGEGLGLDSVDALQLVVALDKNFGLKIEDAEVAKSILKSVSSITEAVQARRA